MKLLFEDGTHQLLPHDHPFYTAFDLFTFIFYCAGFVAGLNFIRLAVEERNLVNFCILFPLLPGGLWILSLSAWATFYFPRRIRHILCAADEKELIVVRDYPNKPVKIAQGIDLRYNIAQGNFAIDLKQRGDAPCGLNFWFEYQGKQFWLSEASPNYRDALYLLAEHAKLRHDPTLHRWERRVFWLRWRAHFKQRPHLPEIIDEVHRILAQQQVRPVVPESVVEIIPTPLGPPTTPMPIEASGWAEEPSQPSGFLIESPPSARDLGDGTQLEIENGQATLIIKQPRNIGVAPRIEK